MAEYIEKEAAIAIIEERQKQLCPVGMYSRHAVYGTDREKYDAWQEILDEIDYLPAANVRENVTGEWIWSETEEGEYEQYWVCSACGEHNFYQAKFCPDCGAQMMNLAKTSQEPRNDFAKYSADEFFDRKKPTNADRIRDMSDEELAEFRAYGDCPGNRYMNDYECDYFHGDCKKCWLDWLRQEADNAGT